MKDSNILYFFTRLPVAVSLAGHGLVRLPKLPAFSDWMVTTMEKSLIPVSVIVPFSYILPVAEAVIGLFLLLGIRTKITLYSALVLMSILIFGSASIENWSAIESQLLHSLYLSALLWFGNKYQVNGETTEG